MNINNIKTLALILGFIAVTISGCDPSKKWRKQEEQQIQDYLGSIGDTVYTKTSSGLYYLDLVVGTGATPAVNDTVSIKYKGTFLSGQVFGENYSDTTKVTFIVGNGTILKGLDEGVRYMKEGGKAKMLLPSSLAYGSYGYLNIGGYTPLLFEVILLKVRPVPHK